MKISTILARYLLANGKLSLKEIGTFYTSLPSGSDKENFSEAGGLYFEFDPKTKMNDEVIAYVSQQSGKMKSLAASDLDSYLQNGKQLINIGKPFIIEGVGSILKKQDGTYLISENHFNPLQEEESTSGNKQHIDSGAELDYDDYKYAGTTKPASGKRTIIIIGSVVVIALIAWMVYKLMNRPATKETEKTLSSSSIDSTKITKDTVAIKDTARSVVIPDSTKSIYKVILYDTTNRYFALSSYDWFRKNNYPLFMETADSVRYKIYFKFPAPFADSVRVRDSIGRRYHKKVIIE